MAKSRVPPSTFATFGELLKYLRRRAHLTQRELSIAVGYSEAEIRRVETNLRLPEKTALQALFVPALGIDDEPEVVSRLFELVDAHVPIDVPPGPEGRSTQERQLISDRRGAAAQAVSSLPTGTVSFLFTDIQDSTPFWEQMPDEMRVSVAQHHSILRQAIEANGGHVFQIIGDGFQSAFRLASNGLNAAIAAQRMLQNATWGLTGPIKVRMGLHTGPAELDRRGDAPYAVSHTLNRAARIMSVGHGGQILLSQEAADLVTRDLPAGMAIIDLGEHHLKGMQRSEYLFQPVVPDLLQVFPPLVSGIVKRNNLPVQLTSFIGREKEISDVIHLLHKNRLVTIHGSGGTGKTRLCLEVAGQTLDSYQDGAWLIELAPLVDADKVPQLVAGTLGLFDSRGRPVLDQLVDYFREKCLLLVLDNCEHLINACARLADRLLHDCPRLTILASSREALGVSGETAYRAPSLSVPGAELPPLEEIIQFEAVRLFAERAASIFPGYTVTGASAAAVASICRQLDGIPLAIELAAARMDSLSAEQIATRLDKRFRLLTGGSRTALPRQQTLRASIDWSYSLLPENERLLLQRLSVFAGGWTLEAAEAVCGFGELEDFEVLDALGQLVKKSLVDADRQIGSTVRYRLLETIRQYSRERLLDTGAGDEVRDRHLGFYMDLAGQAEPHLRGPDQVDWNDRLEVEIDNLRAALEWSRENQVDIGLRIITALKWFWGTRVPGLSGEIAGWLERALAAYPSEDDQPARQIQIRANALAAMARLWYVLGKNGEKVDAVFEESRRLYEKLGPAGRGDLVYLFYYWAIYTRRKEGDRSQSQSLMREGLFIAEELGDRFGIAECLPWVDSTDDLFEKLKISQRCLALRREIGDQEGIWWDLVHLARVYYALGDYSQALQLLQEGMKIAQRIKSHWGISVIWVYQGMIYGEMERFPEAVTCLEHSLRIAQDIGVGFWFSLYEIVLAGILHKNGDEDAAQLRYRDAFEIARKEGDWIEQATIRFCQGEIAWARMEIALAEQYYREVMALAQNTYSGFSALGQYGLGKVAFARGDRAAAMDQFRQAVQTWVKLGANDYIFCALEAMAVVVASPAPGVPPAAMDAIRAVRLHGAGQALSYFGRLTFLSHAQFQPYDVEACLALAREVLGEEAWTRAYSEGQAMKLDQAVQYALGAPDLPIEKPDFNHNQGV